MFRRRTGHAYLKENAQDWTVLRPTWFMQNFSEQQHLATIQNEDAIYSATGVGRVGFVDAADIARAAVGALLAEKAWNRDFILTGPETLSYAEMAARLTRILGRSITHVNLTIEQLAGRFQRNGMDKVYAQTLAAMDGNIAQGSEDQLSDGVLTLSGQPPTTADAFIRRHAQLWQRL